MHMTYCSANCNARMAAIFNEELFSNRYLPGHRVFACLHQRLCDTGKYIANRMDAGLPGRIRAQNEEEILQHLTENTSSAKSTESSQTLGSIASSPLLPTDYRPRKQFAR